MKVAPYHWTLMEDERNKQQGRANRRHCDECVKKA
jgi:hypothetical protein